MGGGDIGDRLEFVLAQLRLPAGLPATIAVVLSTEQSSPAFPMPTHCEAAMGRGPMTRVW